MVMSSAFVMGLVVRWSGALLLLADVAPLPRLDNPTKVKVLAALAGLIILGMGMVALTWLGGRFARRYMNSGVPLTPSQAGQGANRDDWARKPVADVPPAKSGE